MTICVISNLRKALVAISDGRLSRDDDSVSFDTAEKIAIFTPSYKYPKVRLGRFERYEIHTGRRWGIAYSGNYSLATQIRDLTIANSTRLYLDRADNGIPFLSEKFEPGDAYDDSYNFDEGELILFKASDVFGDFEQACLSKGNEWSKTRGFPDVAFLVFGLDQDTEEYVARKYEFDKKSWENYGIIAVNHVSIYEFNIAAIGESATVLKIEHDQDIGDAMIKSVPAQISQAALNAMPPEDKLGAELDRLEPSSTDEVIETINKAIHSTNNASIGGSIMVVSGRGGKDLRFL